VGAESRPESGASCVCCNKYLITVVTRQDMEESSYVVEEIEVVKEEKPEKPKRKFSKRKNKDSSAWPFQRLWARCRHL
jgi:hypothetical protein